MSDLDDLAAAKDQARFTRPRRRRPAPRSRIVWIGPALAILLFMCWVGSHTRPPGASNRPSPLDLIEGVHPPIPQDQTNIFTATPAIPADTADDDSRDQSTGGGTEAVASGYGQGKTVFVHGYYTKSGHYVKEHYRAAPGYGSKGGHGHGHR